MFPVDAKNEGVLTISVYDYDKVRHGYHTVQRNARAIMPLPDLGDNELIGQTFLGRKRLVEVFGLKVQNLPKLAGVMFGHSIIKRKTVLRVEYGGKAMETAPVEGIEEFKWPTQNVFVFELFDKAGFSQSGMCA